MDRSSRKRIALIGTGHRGTSMWGINVVKGYGDYVEIVALCDTNRLRAERARGFSGSTPPSTPTPRR